MWLGMKEPALHRVGYAPSLGATCPQLEMLPLEVGKDKAFRGHFPLVCMQPLKWLSCMSSTSEASAKDVLGVTESQDTCSEP